MQIGSYGLDQCLDAVRGGAGRRPRLAGAPEGWLVGEGIAVAMLDTAPPGGHLAHARIAERPDGGYTLSSGTAEFGNGTTTVHVQLAATALGAPRRPDRAGASRTPTWSAHDTGAYGSTGTGSPATAALRAARRPAGAAGDAAAPARSCWPPTATCDGTRSLGHLQRARLPGGGLAATGEVRILLSVHAADAGTVINPMQCRAQVEGGVAQALGAALYEHVDIDASGVVTTRTLRNYHVPMMADVPRDRGALRRHARPRGRAARRQVDERERRSTRSPRRWPTRSATPPACASRARRWAATGCYLGLRGVQDQLGGLVGMREHHQM